MEQTSTLNYVQNFVDFVKTEDASALGHKVQKQAQAALNVKVAVMKADTLRLQSNIEERQEAVKAAFFNNGQAIAGNGDAYTTNLVQAENNLDAAKKELAQHEKTLVFLESRLSLLTV